MSRTSNASERSRFVGQGETLPTPLPPADQYPGAVAITDEGSLVFSHDGDWRVPSEEVEISKPVAIAPITGSQQAELRLSDFNSATGLSQAGAVFQVSVDGNFDSNLLFERNVAGPAVNSEGIEYPSDGLTPGDTFWWRAKYYAVTGQQSKWSTPFRQTFPDLITTPAPVSKANSLLGAVQVTAFESAPVFGLGYVETEWEFYADGDTPGVDTPVATLTNTENGNQTAIPDDLSEGTSYQFRARHAGRANIGAPLIYSDWSAARSFVAGGDSLIIVFDLTTVTTVSFSIGAPNDIVVDWGDGSAPEAVLDSTGTRSVSHSYVGSGLTQAIVSVSGGSCTSLLGPMSLNVKRLESWGAKLGYTALSRFLEDQGASVEFISPDLPATVTDINSLFRELKPDFDCDISGLDVSNVEVFANVFYSCGAPPAIIRGCESWDMSSAQSLFGMFYDCHPEGFTTIDLSGWVMPDLTDVSFMFRSSSIVTAGIGGWNMSKVTTTESMFEGATAYDEDLGAWQLPELVTAEEMFMLAAAFNNGGSPSINNWRLPKLVNAASMFDRASIFNQPISDWAPLLLEDMTGMFYEAFAFNQDMFVTGPALTTLNAAWRRASNFNGDVSAMDVSQVADFAYAFADAIRFDNPSIIGWDTGNADTMAYMFASIVPSTPMSFNQPIGPWDVSKCRNFIYMFAALRSRNDATFDQDIGAWDMGEALTVEGMFYSWWGGVVYFNNGGSPSINNWRLPKCTNFSYFLFAGIEGSGTGTAAGRLMFNQPIGDWDVSAGVDFRYFLYQVVPHAGAGLFNQPLTDWDLSAARYLSPFIWNENLPYDQDMSGWQFSAELETGDNHIGFGTVLSAAIWSKTLVGWANRVNDIAAPLETVVTVGAGTLYDASFDFSADFPGARFTDAGAARAFLVAIDGVEVSGASNATADGTYDWNGASASYENSVSGWYFSRVGNEWRLYDDSDVQQDVSAGNEDTPVDETGWASALVGATILRSGAGWTINGDASV